MRTVRFSFTTLQILANFPLEQRVDHSDLTLTVKRSQWLERFGFSTYVHVVAITHMLLDMCRL